MIRDITQISMAKALDGLAARHKALAANVANADTPGYRRIQVAFEDQLRNALEQSGSLGPSAQANVRAVTPQTTIDETAQPRENGNTVNIDLEMAQLSENTLSYQAVLRAASIKGEMLRNAIWEGKR